MLLRVRQQQRLVLTFMSLIVPLTMMFAVLAWSKNSFAEGIARARWVDSSHIVLKLTHGLTVFSGTRFLMADSSRPFQGNPLLLDLPLLSTQGSFAVLSTAGLNRATIDQVLQRPLRIFVVNFQNQILDSTALQYAGILDELYYYEGDDLGVVKKSETLWTAKLWAPTAQRVSIRLYEKASMDNSQPSIVFPMVRNNGVWSVALSALYENYFYLYEVDVYQPLTDAVNKELVIDPYSRSLAINSTKSQMVDINSSQSKPSHWDYLQKPALASLKEAVVYELHIRDFSANDENVPFFERGTYLAFSQSQSSGLRHLRELASAGLTHVHLLPFNDFGSVNEDRSTWQTYDGGTQGPLEEPQSVIGRQRQQDSYNWGYDPVNFFTPEGSYAFDAEGVSRLRETRGMIQNLNRAGLRVVQDVVFNHTYRYGLEAMSVFDRIVPGYYYRVSDEGTAYQTSCCADTASENRMMEKLMIDSVVYWAKTFKVDGFRFDLMSFHTHDTMVKIREALRELSLAKDGVDGSKLLLYGEGWAFGSLHQKNPQAAMTLLNSYGLGFGFFNDRLRDAVRGGTTHSSEKSDQGFATGLFFDFNQEPANRNTPVNSHDQENKLLALGDVIKAGLAGNLRDYAFRDHHGQMTRSGQVIFRGDPVGMAAQAIETVNYVSAHDGYTLWDAVQAKAPFYTSGRNPRLATSADRQRMHQLALAIPLLGQGVPFFEAGVDLLRTKQGDQDSYDSGDFFNRVDWNGNTNYWGAGLPPAWKNYDDWSFWQPRLQEPAMRSSRLDIQRTSEYFKALLRLRKSSSLFKLNTLSEISSQVSFIDNDSRPEPGLVAMKLQNQSESLLVFFNASREPRSFSHAILAREWRLHPLLDQKMDPALVGVRLNRETQQIEIPGRTTVVLQMSKELL